MHAPDSVLAFARAGAGLPGKPLRGKFKDDHRTVDVHWGTGGVIPHRPDVEIIEEDGFVTAHIGGTEEQAKRVWKALRKKYGPSIPDWDQLLADANRISEPSPWVEISLGMHLGNLQRFAAKVGLAGGAAIWGDEFSRSGLASRMRAMLKADDGNYDPQGISIRSEYISEITRIASTRIPTDFPDVQVPTPGPGVPRVSQLALAPVYGPSFPRLTTAIFVNILNFPAPPFGIPLIGGLPGRPVLPVVIREELGAKPTVWKLDDMLLRGIGELSDPGWT